MTSGSQGEERQARVTRVDFYALRLSDLFTAVGMRRRGLSVTYELAEPAIRLVNRVFGLRRVTRFLKRTRFEKTISEYEGAFYLLQHETVRLTQDYYRTAHVGQMPGVLLYKKHYRTNKLDSVMKFLLQKEIKRFLTWLYQQRHERSPGRVLIVPDDRLYRFLVERAAISSEAPWPVEFHGSSSPGFAMRLGKLVKCWIRLGSALARQGLGRQRRAARSSGIGFRAHWPRREGLLRTDFLMDGVAIHPDNMLFYLDEAKTARGRRMREFLDGQGYRHVVLTDLRYPWSSLPRLVRDYLWLPLRGWGASLAHEQGDLSFALLMSVSESLLGSRMELLLDHFPLRVVFSFHSAGYEPMVAPILCERKRCQFITYNFGITTFQAQWADYAFYNAHAFFAWGRDVLRIYEDTHDFGEVVNTGFWGFPEYRKALAERERLRAEFGVGPETVLVVFYDAIYFTERSPFTPSLLADFYRAALACADMANVMVILKMKSRENDDLTLYPLEFREEFRKLWDEINARPNVKVCVTLDWDPLQMIAASDVNVTLELSTPSTLALLCGKPGFFFNTVEEHVYHPLFPKYKGRLIFSDPGELVRAIEAHLERGGGAEGLVDEGDLDGYNAGGDEGGLDRFRQETLKRAGLLDGAGTTGR